MWTVVDVLFAASIGFILLVIGMAFKPWLALVSFILIPILTLSYICIIIDRASSRKKDRQENTSGQNPQTLRRCIFCGSFYDPQIGECLCRRGIKK